MRTSRCLLPILLLSLPSPGAAATLPAEHWCGTQRSGLAVIEAAHRDHVRRWERERSAGAKDFSQPQALRAGDIAILQDDGTLVTQPNPFDLAESGLQFVRKQKGVVASAAGSAISAALGQRMELTDDSSALITFLPGFRFKFFGKTYTRVFLNSDGNLTFDESDFQSTERSVARFFSGPPRIAPLFTDLDPERAQGEGGIYVLRSRTKVVITWLEVPEFVASGEPPAGPNTFQLTLFKNGRITFAYGDIATTEAVVGVAPGGGGRIELLDYRSDLPTRTVTVALAERFGASRQLDDLAIAKAFFSEFADDYDHLIVWLDFPLTLGGGAFAYEFTVKNEVRGIGLPVFDSSAQAGSDGRLRSYVQMGSLSRYRSNPDETFLGTNSTMDIMGQETGHRWLAFLTYRPAGGGASTDLLGRDLAHWSFNLDSQASDMEGNAIRDDGGSFTTVGATERFSPLDQYAMGLVPPSAVPPFFFVADSPVPVETAPTVGATFPGRRVNVRIEDVIAAEGARVPASAAAPKTFNMAFVIVAAPGATVQQSSIDKVESYRRRWEAYFAAATDGQGAVDTSLR